MEAVRPNRASTAGRDSRPRRQSAAPWIRSTRWDRPGIPFSAAATLGSRPASSNAASGADRRARGSAPSRTGSDRNRAPSRSHRKQGAFRLSPVPAA